MGLSFFYIKDIPIPKRAFFRKLRKRVISETESDFRSFQNFGSLNGDVTRTPPVSQL
ncbi:Uncharacterized protein dnm_010990 [Desulfonema magnum]|uniref:Uncharacterized protein n=1 Tax=Desulfonema magnum TaxID=45655 RepID=A0A975GL15_9BACT|nr:Uncharacterized protein dnm_010990 [Desulfonema magnum]